MKERLEDIRGESEAERLTRMEDLDTAGLFRLEERMLSVERLEANPDHIRASLSSAWRATTSAKTQTGKLISLTDEAINLRLTFRDLNKFLTAIMEGTVAPGQDAYSSFLIDRIAGLSTVTKEEREILEIYVRLAYGKPQPTMTIPFYLAKKHQLFFPLVLVLERHAREEYQRRKQEQKEERLANVFKELKRLDEGIAGLESRIADTSHYVYEQAPMDLRRYKNQKEHLLQTWEADHEKDMREFDSNWYGEHLRKEVAPKSFSLKVESERDKERVMRACVEEFGSTGTRALQIIREFVGFCTLLAEPENHITKKSGQHTAKQVNTRTEADMTNEMVRNLTALPKYTAYAKVLRSEGQNVWKGKIRTCELRATNEGKADTSETWHYIQLRARIREEIVERHDRLLDESGGESKPPPASY